METDNVAVQQDAVERKGIFKRLLASISFGRPGTTADLEQEIQDLLEEGEEQGLISVHEERLINSIFDFRETIASEIMTPTAEMVCAELNTSVPELIRLINEEGYTRIPIYEGTPDHIIGILHAKDLLRICARGADSQVDLKEFLNPATFIPESKPITELLREFQSKKIHLAIVVDEFGGIDGLDREHVVSNQTRLTVPYRGPPACASSSATRVRKPSFSSC